MRKLLDLSFTQTPNVSIYIWSKYLDFLIEEVFWLGLVIVQNPVGCVRVCNDGIRCSRVGCSKLEEAQLLQRSISR
jgi:hypothetical protein